MGNFTWLKRNVSRHSDSFAIDSLVFSVGYGIFVGYGSVPYPTNPRSCRVRHSIHTFFRFDSIRFDKDDKDDNDDNDDDERKIRKKRSVSQTIDHVMTRKTHTESSKSELSSRGKRPFKVFPVPYTFWDL